LKRPCPTIASLPRKPKGMLDWNAALARLAAKNSTFRTSNPAIV
jgi:hypothetical protein